jgi:hypothetical protein
MLLKEEAMLKFFYFLLEVSQAFVEAHTNIPFEMLVVVIHIVKWRDCFLILGVIIVQLVQIIQL